MSKYAPRLAVGLVSVNIASLGFQYYYNQPLSPRPLPIDAPNYLKVQRPDPLRCFRDPCLTDPQTSPEDLIIFDESRVGKSPPYKSSTSPGKGLGLFATEFIPKGTTIFKEKVVLTCPTQGRLDARDLQNIFDQVVTLSPGLQNGLFSLSGQVPVLAAKTPLMVYYRALLRQDVFYADGSRLAWREYSKLQKAIRIFYTNAAAIYENSSAKWFWKQRSVGDGLFLTFSRMNHSCEPNADWTTYHSPGIMSVWAAKDIEPDEEITISYIGGVDQPMEKRRQRLAQWGFVCQCTKCGAIPKGKGSERKALT